MDGCAAEHATATSTMESFAPTTTLSADSTVWLPRAAVHMPILGLGGGIFGATAEDAFVSALKLGYRLIDTAPKYGESEAALGRAIERSGIVRAELFVQSKVGNVGRVAALRSFEHSLAALRTTYIDLMLMHSAIDQRAVKEPNSPLHAGTRTETWNALVRLRAAGRVKAIGVCNHSARQLAALQPRPDVVQIEFHPMLQRRELLDYCTAHAIAVQAYGTGGGGWGLWRNDPTLNLLHRDPIMAAARAHRRSVHQVVLRWALDKGVVLIPKAENRSHQMENRQIFDFALSPEEMSAISALDEQRSLYRFKDPDIFL
jgi:diketogulonate reductase-like aldo/keto reductase